VPQGGHAPRGRTEQAKLRIDHRLQELAGVFSISVGRFAAMPSHFHLAVWPRGGDLSRWMHWMMTTHVRLPAAVCAARPSETCPVLHLHKGRLYGPSARGDNSMPDPAKLLTTIRRAAELLRATPGREGGVVSLSNAADVMVVGDLHGNLPAFRSVLKIAALDRFVGRHLVLQELIHGPLEYPQDGGDRSHQLVDLVAALKCQYTGRVHVILGNHELSELTGRIIGKDNETLNAKFFRGIKTAYGESAGEVFEAYKTLFAAMPLAVRTPNRVYICHTIPDECDLDRLDLSLLSADVWPAEAMQRRGTIYALTWGRDTDPETADRFAKMVDADFFITGHQPCDEGFQQANHRQIIIDGTDPYPAYCLFPAEGPVTIESLLGCVHIIHAVGA
jgi:hypothetical protein